MASRSGPSTAGNTDPRESARCGCRPPGRDWWPRSACLGIARLAVSPTGWNVRVSITRSSFTWMAGSRSPSSSRNTDPSGGTGFEPALAIADRAGERPAAMAEQLGFHQRRRKRRDVDREKGGIAVVRESQPALVERHVARLRDGARRQLLAGSGGPVISVAKSPMRAYSVRR